MSHKILLILALFIGLIACSPKNKTKQNMQNENFDTYESLWKEVKSFEKDKRPKSALEKSDIILALAKKNKNIPQILKALNFRIKFDMTRQEGGLEKAIIQLENYQKEYDYPINVLLNTFIADLYNQYFINNQYKISQRTNMMDIIPDDLETWTNAHFIAKIAEKHKAALDPRLKQYKTADFQDILTTGQNDEGLRKTVYELLLFKALDYYKNTQSHLSESVNAFKLTALDFADHKIFTQQVHGGKQSSMKLQAILLFKKILNNYTDSPIDLAHADLLRLEYVKNNYKGINKSTLYKKALDKLSREHKNTLVSAEIFYYLARERSVDENENLPQLIEECKVQINKWPESLGAGLCQNLIFQLERQSLSVQFESIILPDEKPIALVNYKNIEKIYYFYRPYDKSILNNYYNINPQQLLKNKLTKIQSIESLKQGKDLKNHSTELAFEALKGGQYLLIISDNKDFDKNKGVVSITPINFSHLAFTKVAAKYIVQSRLDNSVIEGAKLAIFENNYDQDQRKYVKKLIATLISDKNGEIDVFKGQNRNYFGTLSYKNEKIDVNLNNNNHIAYTKTHKSTSFFLDRAIYRPNQKILFKGLLIEYPNSFGKIVPNKKVNIELFDANYKSIQSLDLVSNEFGTVSGEFVLPDGLLNGEFHLKSNWGNGQKYFSVEEYKRPQFEITFSKNIKAYKLGEEVTLEGDIRSYSGSPMSNIPVEIVVEESPIYRYYYWQYYKSQQATSTKRVVTETIMSDDKGHFKIKFKTRKDISNSSGLDYAVNVKATNLTGETHERNQHIKVAKDKIQSVQISENTNGQLSLKSVDALTFRCLDINGVSVESSFKLIVHQLIKPTTKYRKRLWQSATLNYYTKHEFEKMLPNYAYNDPKNGTQWGSAGQETFIVKANKKTPLNSIIHKTGLYRFEYYSLDGQLINKKRFEIKDIILEDLFRTSPINKLYNHPTLAYNIDKICPSKKMAIFINYETSKEVTYLDNTLSTYRFTPKAGYFGSISLAGYFYENNRLNQFHKSIFIDKNKPIEITLTSYRDITKPGAHETWTFDIENPNVHRSMEMVATMYDQSLDAFVKHEWSWSNIYKRSTETPFFILTNMHTTNARMSQSQHNPYRYPMRQYKSFNIFNWNRYYLNNVPMMERDNASYGGVVLRGSRAPTTPKMKEIDGLAVSDIEREKSEEVGISSESTPNPKITMRKDFSETVFFKPQIKIEHGRNTIEFDMKSSLTKWKAMVMVHDKKLATDYKTYIIETRKELMIEPFTPRYLREGDQVVLTAKVSNLTSEAIVATVNLSSSINTFKDKTLTLAPNSSQLVEWILDTPTKDYSLLELTFKAHGKRHNDAITMSLPIISNQKKIVETQPFEIFGSKTFEKTLSKEVVGKNNLEYTLEYTSNPAWYVVQALPYLENGKNDISTSYLIERYLINSMSNEVIALYPEIEATVKAWEGSDQLESNLAKNLELKYTLLEASPWVRAAEQESKQKSQIKLLFDKKKVQESLSKTYAKIISRIRPNGGLSWCDGGKSNWYITQHFLENLSFIKEFKSSNITIDNAIKNMIIFIDEQLVADYKRRLQNPQYKVDLKKNHLTQQVIHYLYTRSKIDLPMNKNTQEVYDYYLEQVDTYWHTFGFYENALIGFIADNTGNTKLRNKITLSLKENIIYNDEIGAHWKYPRGYGWYQEPITTHAFLTMYFEKIVKEDKIANKLKKWLVKNKQTNNWGNFRSTAFACLTFLDTGENCLEKTTEPKIYWGDEKLENEGAKGSGYFKQVLSFKGQTSKSLRIVSNASENCQSYGAIYTQFVQKLSDIETFDKTALKVTKALYIVKQNEAEAQLRPITANDSITKGKTIRVRIVIETDRAMQYIHLNEMRSAGFEPTEALSQYKWKSGLGYYENISDTSTDFFISYLSPGKYVFEYDVFAVHSGKFDNGITTIQSYYAPEFTSHSAGAIIDIK